MTEQREGVIKYKKSEFEQTPPLPLEEYRDLERLREKLHRTKLIGVYPNGLGYGNISVRRGKEFIITGTQTGHLEKLSGEHYTRVLDFSLEDFSLKAKGPVEASSEALTHASLYLFCDEIQVIAHIHSREIWEGMLKETYPKTSEKIEYGTKEMAYAIRDCLKGINAPQGTIVMAGHEDGVIIFGPSLDIVERLSFELYRRFSVSS